jgi:hypothetical protein
VFGLNQNSLKLLKEGEFFKFEKMKPSQVLDILLEIKRRIDFSYHFINSLIFIVDESRKESDDAVGSFERDFSYNLLLLGVAMTQAVSSLEGLLGTDKEEKPPIMAVE